jgi:nitrite reductase/ring-hydroxylating ferredoxin subunit
MESVEFATSMKRHPVAQAAEIPTGGRRLVSVGRIEIGLFNVDGEIHAYRNACPHAGAPVCLGRVSGTSLPSRVYEYIYGKEGCILRCPWHGWEFDLRTGEHVVDPETRLKEVRVEATRPENLDRLPVEEAAGTLYVLLPD